MFPSPFSSSLRLNQVPNRAPQQKDSVRLLFQKIHYPIQYTIYHRKMVNTIWFQFYLIRFRKDFSVCKIWNFYSDQAYCAAFRHHGGTINGPPESPFENIEWYRNEGSKKGSQLGPKTHKWFLEGSKMGSHYAKMCLSDGWWWNIPVRFNGVWIK